MDANMLVSHHLLFLPFSSILYKTCHLIWGYLEKKYPSRDVWKNSIICFLWFYEFY